MLVIPPHRIDRALSRGIGRNRPRKERRHSEERFRDEESQRSTPADIAEILHCVQDDAILYRPAS